MAVTVDQLKDVRDVAHGAIGELSERLKDADVVQHLPPLREARARKARKARRRVLLLVLVGVGIGVAVSIYLRKQNEQQLPDVAPDAFGEAVEEERAASLIGRSPQGA